MRAKTGRAVVARADSERHRVERLDGGPTLGDEGDMGIATALHLAAAEPEGRALDAIAGRFHAVILELGKQLAKALLPKVQGTAANEGNDASTKALLAHYRRLRWK